MDPSTDRFALRILGKFNEELENVDRAPLGRFDDEVDFAFEDLDEELMVTPGVTKAREGLRECGRIVATLFGIFARNALRAASDQLRARREKDEGVILSSMIALLGNAAWMALACDALGGLHEAFVGNLMGERPGPREAARRLKSVTCLLENLQAGLQDARKGGPGKLPDLVKEGFPALRERFGTRMGDLTESYRWLCSKGRSEEDKPALRKKKLNLAAGGAVLSTEELCRDLLIYAGMLGDMAENCSMPWTDLEGAYQWNQPLPAGDGKSPETAYRFLHARNKFEAVGMAHEMLGNVRSWNISSVSETELLEYAETDKGKVWIRYRMDARLPVS